MVKEALLPLRVKQEVKALQLKRRQVEELRPSAYVSLIYLWQII